MLNAHLNTEVTTLCERVTISEPNCESQIRFSLDPDSTHLEVCWYQQAFGVIGTAEVVGPTVTLKLTDFLEDSWRKSRLIMPPREMQYPHHGAIAALAAGLVGVDEETKRNIVDRVIFDAERSTMTPMDDRLAGEEERFDLNVMVKLKLTTIYVDDDNLYDDGYFLYDYHDEYFLYEDDDGDDDDDEYFLYEEDDDVHWMVPAAKEAIEGLERVRFGDVANSDGERQCVICFEDFEGESLVTRLGCSHVFHCDCLFEWLDKSHYCPLCRFELPIRDD